MKKFLLAAAAVVTLAVPAISMAQPYYGYHEGWREAPRMETWRYEERREAALREARREEAIRAAHWRWEHQRHEGYYGYRY